ncbi:MAG: hypothetical protein IJ916_08865 [Paludibacteraceae bacterium]|nr:hypothetical protein [Paludibacteraceae bacterium]
MKSLNGKEVLLAYVKFTACMVALIVMVQFFIFSFLRSSEAEIAEIKMKTGDSEIIFREQSDLCDRYEEIFSLCRAFDVSDNSRSDFLMQSIASRKKDIEGRIAELPQRDVQLHSFMLSKMNEFFRVRDSISVLKKEEQKVKKDFLTCSGDYEKVRVKVKHGVLTAN